MRERADLLNRCLRERLNKLLPAAMREAGLDMWLVICQEDHPDPVFETMVSMDTWAPILQMLMFHDRGPGLGVERISLSQTDTRGLYEQPWRGRHEHEQWSLLAQIVTQRAPKRIGINIGRVQWAAGGLTYNLHRQLTAALPPKYARRLVSAEPACVRWLATLTKRELSLFRQVVEIGHQLIAECFSPRAIKPGVTTTEDLRWHYWQRCTDLGLDISFLPFFFVRRAPANAAAFGLRDRIIRRGDCVVCDVGIRYLGFCSDHQQWVYVLRRGERDAPAGLKQLMAEAHRLQDVFLSEFRPGPTGNQLLANILDRARREGIPNPRVYSHSLGRFLHEPGALIGLPWEQDRCPGRGDVTVEYDTCYTMELSVEGPLPEWQTPDFRFNMEEDVMFTRRGCQVIDGRQTEFFLI